jgi:hypothetical protein
MVNSNSEIILIWAHQASLTPPCLIDVPMPRYGIERSCILVLPVSIVPLSTICVLILELFRRFGIFLLCLKQQFMPHFPFRYNQFYVKLFLIVAREIYCYINHTMRTGLEPINHVGIQSVRLALG